MKKLNVILLILLLVDAAVAQTIRRVNNNAGVTGVNVYTTAQAAHNAAAANDILLIEPSATSYGALTLTKPLKIYGNGYFLATNTELKADQKSSTLLNAYFDSGSGGSSMDGVEVTNYTTIYGASNISIQRCKLFAIRVYNANLASTPFNISNILIAQNFCDPIEYFHSTPYTASNVLITNNFLSLLAANSAGVQNWMIVNNTFTGNAVSTTVGNSVFTNNLMAGPGSSTTFTNTTVSYNVASGAAFSGGTGNQNNYNVTADRVPSGAGVSTDETYQLIASSPLKTAGAGGIEVGAFGGSSPYVISGIPAIPSIVNLNSAGTGSNSVPLQVTISVKSNN